MRLEEELGSQDDLLRSYRSRLFRCSTALTGTITADVIATIQPVHPADSVAPAIPPYLSLPPFDGWRQTISRPVVTLGS